MKSANEANCRSGDYLNSVYFSHVQSTIELPLDLAFIYRLPSALCFMHLLDKGPDLFEEINVWQLELQAERQKQEASFSTFHTWPHNVQAWSTDGTLTSSALSPQPWICSKYDWILSNNNTAEQSRLDHVWCCGTAILINHHNVHHNTATSRWGSHCTLRRGKTQ